MYSYVVHSDIQRYDKTDRVQQHEIHCGIKYISEVHHDPIDPVLVEADVGEAPEGDGQPGAAERAAEGDEAVDLVGVPRAAEDAAPRDGARAGVPLARPAAEGNGAHLAAECSIRN